MNVAGTIRRWITAMAMVALCAFVAAPAYSDYESSLKGYWKMDEFNRNDNFSGTSFNASRWNARDIGGNGALSVSDSLNLSGTFRDISSKSTLSGDFDIQIDYSNAQLGGSSGTKSIAILAWRDDYQAQIYAVRAKVNVDNRYYMQEYNGSTWAYGSNVSTSDTSGKLRLTRSGSTFTGYEWTGSAWSALPQPASQVTFSGPVYIGAQMNSNNDQISVTFDNFRVNNQSVADATGSNSGTALGATSVIGQTGFGNALNFNGTGDYVDLGTNVLRNLPTFTVSAWVKAADFSSSMCILGSNQSGYDQEGVLLMTRPSGGIALSVYDNAYANRINILGDLSLASGEWNHVVAEMTGPNSLALYVNGVKDSAITNIYGTGASDSGSSTTSTKIGRYNFDSLYQYFFNGSIDDVATWSRALDPNEIDMLYDLGTEKFEWLTLGINDPDALDLGYTTSELKLLAELYAEGNTGASETIDNLTWHYLSGDLPGDIGGTTYDYGDTWTYEGKYYLKLGSGLEGASPIPEPATVLGLLLATTIGLAGRRMKWVFRV